ncbi:MmcQ/YjbR family DNA-binding protein [Streptomonospora nanhaiensis]|uniref:Putative DNA-binding protein (MmcQ/YjbR family) n=1 Tax=Streptomonospora nanhaiensis TaxID=1323731 RepID=A0A853BRM6_9ACTN|nr:MmcQ/YjbR family DNA-binding protein [Streptomonospora nanhaiensis]MBV2364965.1 MmcQ/YjbR family DNA-binding protein [Streptomonospora nanhaiensis]MBX9389797.1 MmcQ/YjbR family DNA-binding protein [Streptomonospora nanhaiensis]NYI97514.1 putative DNA-binding protein (MmcQ/YjbR family) [Streptomonospora nanhaiensis]
MDGKTLWEAAQRCAEALPGARLEYPFGPGHEVFKVGGRMFLLATDAPGEPVVVLKADPADAEALRAAHADITPGYHMNKRHWITLAPGGSLDEGLVAELVAESYRLVVAGLPRSRRPAGSEAPDGLG